MEIKKIDGVQPNNEACSVPVQESESVPRLTQFSPGAG